MAQHSKYSKLSKKKCEILIERVKQYKYGLPFPDDVTVPIKKKNENIKICKKCKQFKGFHCIELKFISGGGHYIEECPPNSFYREGWYTFNKNKKDNDEFTEDKQLSNLFLVLVKIIK